MQKRERRLTAAMLGVIALFSAGMTVWVLKKEQPPNVKAFENRFADIERLGFAAGEGMALETGPDRLRASWDEVREGELAAVADRVAVTHGTGGVSVTVYAGGRQNALGKARWGYRVWLELKTVSLSDGRVVDRQRIELPMESDKERARACTVSARTDARSVCVCQASLLITPLNGKIDAGYVTLKNWEVSVR